MERLVAIVMGSSFAAACSAAGGPAATCAAMIRAQATEDVAAIRSITVSPDALAGLLDCPAGTKATWNTVAERAAKIERMIAHGRGCGGSDRSVALESFDGEYSRSEWRSYRAGDTFENGDCTVRAPFAVERYRVVLGSKSAFAPGKLHRSHKPMVLWHVGNRWLVWDDPLENEGCE